MHDIIAFKMLECLPYFWKNSKKMKTACIELASKQGESDLAALLHLNIANNKVIKEYRSH